MIGADTRSSQGHHKVSTSRAQGVLLWLTLTTSQVIHRQPEQDYSYPQATKGVATCVKPVDSVSVAVHNFRGALDFIGGEPCCDTSLPVVAAQVCKRVNLAKT